MENTPINVDELFEVEALSELPDEFELAAAAAGGCSSNCCNGSDPK